MTMFVNTKQIERIRESAEIVEREMELEEKRMVAKSSFCQEVISKGSSSVAEMTLNEFQKKAFSFCTENSNNRQYAVYNFLGEVGEFLDKLFPNEKGKISELVIICKFYGSRAKDIRKGKIKPVEIPFSDKKGVVLELGDIMWQLNHIFTTFGFSASAAAYLNLDKLSGRVERNTIVGEGDYR